MWDPAQTTCTSSLHKKTHVSLIFVCPTTHQIVAVAKLLISRNNWLSPKQINKMMPLNLWLMWTFWKIKQVTQNWCMILHLLWCLLDSRSSKSSTVALCEPVRNSKSPILYHDADRDAKKTSKIYINLNWPALHCIWELHAPIFTTKILKIWQPLPVQTLLNELSSCVMWLSVV